MEGIVPGSSYGPQWRQAVGAAGVLKQDRNSSPRASTGVLQGSGRFPGRRCLTLNLLSFRVEEEDGWVERDVNRVSALCKRLEGGEREVSGELKATV